MDGIWLAGAGFGFAIGLWGGIVIGWFARKGTSP